MKQTIITFILALLPIMASAEIFGWCGNKLTFSLKGVTLTISGTGEMTNYNNSYHAPWFDYGSRIKNIIIESGVTSIGNYAFRNCSSLTSITIPNSVTSIGSNAFQDCSAPTSITIPNSVTSIGEYAFYKCSGLTSISIPNSVTSIGREAFIGCSGLTSITIPNSVTSIEFGAFSGCTGLTSITIGNSVTSIDYDVFQYCIGLTSISVEAGNEKYDSRENCNGIIEKETNTLITGCRNTTIPNSVTSIGVDAFYGCTGLTSVTIPNSVTSIEWSAFQNCSSLTSITIPNSVTSIGGDAFSGCIGLTSIISINNTPPTCKKNYNGSYTLFDSVDKTDCIVWVPRESAQAYNHVGGWNDFENIRELTYGDVNIDFKVNKADLEGIVAFIMGRDPESFYDSLGDLNGDKKVDAADLTLLINLINKHNQ